MAREASDLGGIIAMLAATAAFVVGDSFMKIVIEDLPPFEVLFLRIAYVAAIETVPEIRRDKTTGRELPPAPSSH